MNIADKERILILIEWPGNLELGIPRIDAQHRILVAIINRLYVHLSRGMSEGDLDGIIDELSAYAEMHFEDEMQYFREYNFPSAKAHEEEHAKFVRIVEDCRTRIAGGDRATATELMYFLASWLSKHIGREDHELVRIARLGRVSPFSPDCDTGPC